MTNKEIEIRTTRDNLLAASDWTQIPDANLTDNERARWREYRQLLRDVPEQEEYPNSVVWPTEPKRDIVAEGDLLEV